MDENISVVMEKYEFEYRDNSNLLRPLVFRTIKSVMEGSK